MLKAGGAATAAMPRTPEITMTAPPCQLAKVSLPLERRTEEMLRWRRTGRRILGVSRRLGTVLLNVDRSFGEF